MTMAVGRGGRRTTPGSRWSVIADEECRDLWIRGRGPLLLFAFSLLLSAMTYLSATNSALNFLEQREAVNLTLQVALSVGLLLTLVVAGDAVSGDRERGILEPLLLTPASRRAILAGKLFAALTLWLGCYLVSLPYLAVLGRGVAATRQAALLGLVVGTLVALGLTCLGLVISAGSNSNKTSLAGCLLLLFALFAPTQIPALPKNWVGDLLVRVNPIGSALHYISQILVNRHSWTQDLSYLISPLLLAVLAGAALIVAGPRMVQLRPGVNAG
ncbi:MAG TPA: ABC transporter permease subunit [Kribbella sp.]|nr:ABC transporter permease subunit [Kribbella sp.]